MTENRHDATVQELVARAKRYPFERPRGSYVFTHHRLYPVPHPAGPWSPELEVADGDITAGFEEICRDADCPPDYALEERTAVFGYASNCSPEALAHKFAVLDHVVVPVISCRVSEWDVVYSCHFSRGYVPGTLHPSPGAELTGVVTWLTADELQLMDESEPNYELGRLEGATVVFENGDRLDEPLAYFTLHGELRVNDLPVAVAGTTATGRRFGEMSEPDLLELVHPEIDPDRPLDETIAAAIESPEEQGALTGRLKQARLTTPGGIPERPGNP